MASGMEKWKETYRNGERSIKMTKIIDMKNFFDVWTLTFLKIIKTQNESFRFQGESWKV